MNEYPVGNLVRITAEFYISGTPTWNGIPINPTALWVEVQKGSTKTQFVWGVDPEVIMLATGTFYMDVLTDQKGLYYYLFYSSGTGQAARQKSFQVTDTIAS